MSSTLPPKDNVEQKSLNLPPTDHEPAAYSGPSKSEVLRKRQAYVNPAIFHYYADDPLMIVEGHRQYLYDETGRRYLDGFAGIVTVSVGHSHPKVIAAAQRQLDVLQHTTTIYLHPNIAEYAERLASKLPEPLNRCYFVNSGSEANELAILMSRAHTGNHDVIALRNGYHGGSGLTMALTSHHTWKYNLPAAAGIQHALCPDRLRGPYGYDDSEAGAKYAGDVLDLIRFGTSGQVAAFIAESIQGVGGAVVHPEGYLRCVYEHVRAHGGVCIADEVQSGFGRTGTQFWGFQTQDVTPDLVVMAKGIGNGAPLGAVVTTDEIAQNMTDRIHFNTYGGNPVSMAQASAVLEVIDEEGLQENSHRVGGYLKQKLEGLQECHEAIGDVRGMGLMLGVELVSDRETMEPNSALAGRVVSLCREFGLLLGKGGLAGNVLRIKPPMCITQQDAEFMTACIDKALSEA
ncbi:MAG: aminotransferase class III-fold pyridoxal phosphate-dependent enzyme [Planctomycetota bacterium]